MEKKDLRIVFMGTPEFAVATLRALVEGGYHVVAVVTQPDKPVGRHQDTLQPSEVKRYALSAGLPVLQPVKMKDEAFLEQLRGFRADVQVVVAFRMLPEVVWAMPRFGTFNVHAALLPQYRGAAPINWAIIRGETLTGVTTFFLDKDIDTGRIIMQEAFDIRDDHNAEDVYEGLMHLGADVALRTIDRMLQGDGHVDSHPQPLPASSDGPLFPAPKIFKETCQVCWQQRGKQVYDFVRGLSPYPGAWTTLVLADGKKVVMKLFKTAKTSRPAVGAPGTVVEEKGHLFVAATDSMLELLEVQLTGKKRMAASLFLNGFRDIGSCRFE